VDVSSTPRLLLVDDEPQVMAILERFTRGLGFEVETSTDSRDAVARIAGFRPHAVVLDVGMPDVDGFQVLRRIQTIDPECLVVFITGRPTVDSAIEAIKLGALDYLSKPIDWARFEAALTTVRERMRRRERLLRADADIARQVEFHGMVGRSAPMQQLFDSIRRLAPHVRTVLVTGETGTGKELVARALNSQGPRAGRRFVTINCSAVVGSLFESELFGHVRGAFTGATDAKVGVFEHAHGGTLFLDEVGELPLSLQAKLLRAVEYGEVQRVGSLDVKKVDVHLIAATNRDLRVEVEAGRFRRDLFYRLSIIELPLVPLRERRDDIPYLTARFVRDFAERFNRPITGVSASAERLLRDAPWRGNIRELRNVLERACILSDSEILTERDLDGAFSDWQQPTPVPSPVPPAHAEADESLLLSAAHKAQIERAMREAGGNKSEAARLLGVSRRSLYRWLDRLSIERPRPGEV
ncbi:MAG: sigma-54 dependent transcriptional regulator, partial [Vicinamibacterales bacterium]